MKIAEIHCERQDLPVKGGPCLMSCGQVWSLTATLVKPVSDPGHVGWGQACRVGPTYADAHAKGALAALQRMAPGLIGHDPCPVPPHRRMDALPNGHAFDIAAHDLIGQALGASVPDLPGRAMTDGAASCHSIGPEPPEDAARIVVDQAVEG